MIRRTLVQMTVWNSTIVFCLFVMLGGALYGLARYQIYSDIDRHLTSDIDHMKQVILGTGSKSLPLNRKNRSVISWVIGGIPTIP
ncbi:hypothetical protein D3H35_22835 [Cohnella faecalis]|uniref:Uncharacterized protein n=1 Tax=Cohnella faecalis TaxID=2315694 RepID=A0A398CGZ6_9BACL|nr:hypothetical protein D3H35_22835 [Cohnella faecalis]